jgi:hypothetical protein
VLQDAHKAMSTVSSDTPVCRSSLFGYSGRQLGCRSASYFLFLKYRLIRRIRSSLLNICASRLGSGEDTPHRYAGSGSPERKSGGLGSGAMQV